MITPSGTLDIVGEDICLRGGLPVINSLALRDFRIKTVREEVGVQMIQYQSAEIGNGLFTLEIIQDPRSGHLWLRYWLEDFDPAEPLDSFGLHFQGVENLRAYLRSGYMSWDGSAYVDVETLAEIEPDEARLVLGYAVTQLIPRLGDTALLLGFDRHDRFQHTFTFEPRCCPPALTVQTCWDRKDRTVLLRCESERLIVSESRQAEEGLRDWAYIIARASPLAPRLHKKAITGWSSWYDLYANISQEIILDCLQNVKTVSEREKLPMRVFQIDDGFTPEMGDWLEVKPQFPRGMKPIMDAIRDAGFIPGLWIAPFMVGNRSRLYREHPDWVIQDRDTGGPLIQWRHVGEYRWHKRSEEYYILDATHPDAFKYLRHVFRVWRREWGCEYFKTDFMHYGSDYRTDRAIWHSPGFTRIEVWRKVAEMIREEIGEAYWLGSGCPLWASIGLVDAVRIAHDVGVDWLGQLSAQSLLSDLSTRCFANQILWQVDPDCILLRNRFHNLTDQEVRSLAIYAGMGGGVLMTSDDLQSLSVDRLQLWKFLLESGAGVCSFPFLGTSPISYSPKSMNGSAFYEARLADPVIVQVRPVTNREPGDNAVFILNSGEHALQRSYTLKSLGMVAPLWVFDFIQNQAWPEAVDWISLTLDPHDGKLFLLSEKPYAGCETSQGD
jgi:hypothetical protein